jgi:apolipoprotein N-acyltransferase
VSQTLRRIAGRTALALLGAFLFAFYALRPQYALVPYFALVPWTILYTDPKRGRVSWGYMGLAAFVAWVCSHTVGFKWGWFAPPAMAICFAPGWLAFPFLMRPVQKLGLPRALTVPIVWVAVEWIRVAIAVGHFDIYLLGYSQARFVRLVQIADLLGVYGVSFLVAAWNGLVADAFFAWRDSGRRFAALRADRRLVRSAIAVVGACVVAVAYGVVRLATVGVLPGPTLTIVQPNVAHTLRNYLGVGLTELAQTDASVAPGSADLIVWPENSILDDLDRKGAYLEDLKILLERKHAWLLLGAQGHPESRPDRSTNSAYLLDPEGRITGRYDKQILYPWSEYVPFDGSLGRIAPAVQRAHRALVRKAWGYVSTGTPGDRTTLLQLTWNGTTLPFAALICVENSYPPLVAEAGRMGARFFVNITSEGEIGGVIQEQLLRICMMRAIENRIAYVRCGNTGISGFIDPDGRLRSVLTNAKGRTISVAGELTDRVRLARGGPTLYARSHDAFALLCLLAACALAVAGMRRRPAAIAVPLALLLAALAGTTSCGGGRGLDNVCPDEASCREALPKLAETFRQRDALERAIDVYGRIIERFPSLSAEARSYRAYFLDRSGDYVLAAKDCEAALKEAPSAATWALLGSLRSRMRDPRAALEAFEQGQRLAPGDSGLAFLVARSLWETGDLARARSAVEALLAARPDQASSLTLLAKLDIAEGKVEEAKAVLDRAAAAEPSHLECRYYLARLAWREGRPDEFNRWLAELRANEDKLGRGRALDN